MFLQKNLKIFFQNLKKIPLALTIGTWLGFCIVLGSGIFLLLRREAGFFCQTVPLAGIFIFSIVFGITVLLLYFPIRAWSAEFPNVARLLRCVLTGILLLEYLLVGLAIQIPGTSIPARLVFVLCFLLVAGILCRFEFCRPVAESKPNSRKEFSEESEELQEEDDSLPPDVNQKLERLLRPDGSVEISGLLRADFSPNQTKVSLFVAFCPPFRQIPTVECFSPDDLARVEIIQNAPHGVQLSVRKARPVPFDDSVVLTFRAGS